MQPAARVRLSVGPTTVFKVLSTFVAIVFIGFAVAAVAFGVIAAATTGATGPTTPADPGTDPSTAPFVTALPGIVLTALGCACALPFALGGGFVLLSAWRSGMWLDGTVVTAHGALVSRRVDLATATVRMAGITYRQGPPPRVRVLVQVPAVEATAPGAAKPVRIPLRDAGLNLLPAGELLALADALAANRGADADRAATIADHVRGLTTDPLAY
jgi:hypothetical protein